MILSLVLAGALAASCNFHGRWEVFQDGERISAHNSELTAISKVHTLTAGCSKCRIGYRSNLPAGMYRYICITPVITQGGTEPEPNAVVRLNWTEPTHNTDGTTADIAGYTLSHWHDGVLSSLPTTERSLEVELPPGLHAFSVVAIDTAGVESDPSNALSFGP